MIPKVIHFAWFSGEEKPIEVTRCLETWAIFAPDFEIREWDADSFPWNDADWTREAFQKRKWAFVTDYFRLWVLANYGGIYMDSDVDLHGSLNSLLDTELFVGMEHKNIIGAHIIGAKAKHPFIESLLGLYQKKHFIGANGKMDQTPMPFLVTEEFKKMYGNFNKTESIVVYLENILTLNALDGRNIAAHRMFGSWLEKTAMLPMEHLYLRRYFWNEFIDYSLNPKRSMLPGKVKGNLKVLLEFLLKMFLPHYAVMLYLKLQQKKVRNNIP